MKLTFVQNEREKEESDRAIRAGLSALELGKCCGFTLRSLLPKIKDQVELVIRDEFGRRVGSDADLYRLKANSGKSLLNKLARSRVVDGESLLGLTPDMKLVEPLTSLVNGTFAYITAGYIQLIVEPPVPEG